MARRRFLARVLVPVLTSLSVLVPLLASVPSQAADAGQPLSWLGTGRMVTDPTSYVSIVGELGEPVTQGSQRLWRTDDVIEVAGNVRAGVEVRVGGDRFGSYELFFRSPLGSPLEAGSYVVTEERHTPDEAASSASLAVSGEQRACNQGLGHFTVHDVAPDLSRLWVTYELRCDGVGEPAIRGEVRLDSPPSESLEVLPDRVEWGTARPGRSYGTQPVFIVNHGDEPTLVGPAEVTGEAFSLAGTTCGVVLPGASCALHLAFDPLTNGTERGLLRLSTAASEDVVTIPLSGVGNVGTTYVHARRVYPDGQVFDTSVTPEHGEFRAWTTDRGVSIRVTDQRASAALGQEVWDWVSVAAALGDRLEAGRTYTAACLDEDGATLDLPRGSCRSAPGTGRFALDTLRVRPDGSLAELRGRASIDHVEDGSRTTATFAWQADEQAPSAPPAPFLELAGPPEVAQPGTVPLTAVYPAGHGILAVDVYAESPVGRTLVGTSRVGTLDDTAVSLDVDVQQDTTFVAVARTWDDVVSSQPLEVVVSPPAGPAGPAEPTVSLALRAPQGYRVAAPRAPRRLVAQLALAPGRGGQCLRVEVQRRAEGRWLPRSVSGCRRSGPDGTATAQVTQQTGTRLRARAVWFQHDGARVASGWRVVRPAPRG